MTKHICIHGHFYQPPRENPWLESIEQQESAHPYHDWNERIDAECYAPNASSRILDGNHRIRRITNNYSRLSFNFGPTLLSWMEHADQETYRAILDADYESGERCSGHGGAMAQAYNHIIMPLANLRDKHTQVIWGIRDFEHRFKRKPEGMWLPETAVDTETLETLAHHGILFTVLAPRQAARVRRIGTDQWIDVGNSTIDPKLTYRSQLPSGKSINLFFYDGPISQEIAFGDLLSSGERFAERLVSAFRDDASPQLVHIATDGETYGHHHDFADMALAYCLHHIEEVGLARITNYGEYLEQHPPEYEVEIVENSSWSCVHGIERWRSNCGCNSGRAGWTQEWRGPLRTSLDWLRDRLSIVFEHELREIIRDPWQARDEYIDVILDRSEDRVGDFLRRHAVRDLSRAEQSRALKLLEMQRHCLLMYTSCGWFFDEISGIETVQVMQYASRAIQLAHQHSHESLEPEFTRMLSEGRSNIHEIGNAGAVWEMYVKPASVDLFRVCAHYAITSLFGERQRSESIYGYSIDVRDYDSHEAGKQKLAIGQADIRSRITWEESRIMFAVLHLGGHTIHGGVRIFRDDAHYASVRKELADAFGAGDVAGLIRGIDRQFGSHTYSLWHLMGAERRKILNEILHNTLEEMESLLRHLTEEHVPIMTAMKEMRVPIPEILSTASEFIINKDILKLVSNGECDPEKLRKLLDLAAQWNFDLDTETIGFAASGKLRSLAETIEKDPSNLENLQRLRDWLSALSMLPLQLDLRKVQNIMFTLGESLDPAIHDDPSRREWMEVFRSVHSDLALT